MDVAALYPSIAAETAGLTVRKAVEATPLTFSSVNYELALRYISKCAKSQEEIEEWGLGEWCPKRTASKGARPGMSDTATIDKK